METQLFAVGGFVLVALSLLFVAIRGSIAQHNKSAVGEVARLIDPEVAFPIRVLFANGEFSIFTSVSDLECNLEDFDSDREKECTAVDANNRLLRIKLSTLHLSELTAIKNS